MGVVGQARLVSMQREKSRGSKFGCGWAGFTWWRRQPRWRSGCRAEGGDGWNGRRNRRDIINMKVTLMGEGLNVGDHMVSSLIPRLLRNHHYQVAFQMSSTLQLPQPGQVGSTESTRYLLGVLHTIPIRFINMSPPGDPSQCIFLPKDAFCNIEKGGVGA